MISGSMGEGHHLTHEERQLMIRTARRVLDAEQQPSLAHVPIIAGTGAGSTKETIQLSKEAAEAGADLAIVIISGYFAGALDRQALKDFWTEVSEKSPIPVLIYNCTHVSQPSHLCRTCLTTIGYKKTQIGRAHV